MITVKQLFEDFKDYGGSIIRIIADCGNFDTRIGYNYIDKEHSMWHNFMAMYGDYVVTEWSVEQNEIKGTSYSLITLYAEKNEYESRYTEEKMIALCQSVDKPMTYKEKFVEVFGYEPDTDNLETPCDMFDCTGARCAECKYGHMKWHWDDEYRER